MSTASVVVEKHATKGKELPAVLCMAFSFDGSVLAVGTTDGFVVYNISGGHGGSGGNGSGNNVQFKEHPTAAAAEAPAATSTRPTPAGHSFSSNHRSTFQEVSRRYFPGGIAHIALVEQSNVLLLSGAEEQYRHAVMLWDDSRASMDEQGTSASRACVVAQLSLDSSVRAMRLSRHCIIVAEAFHTHVFDSSLHLVESYATPNAYASTAPAEERRGGGDNNASTIALGTKATVPGGGGGGGLRHGSGASHPRSVLRMVVLGPSVGSVRCIEYLINKDGKKEQQPTTHANDPLNAPAFSPPPLHDDNEFSATRSTRSTVVGGSNSTSSGGSRLTTKMAHPQPHERPVQAIGINIDGTVAITVSERGTAFKVIDVASATVLRQLNRGTTSRLVQSIAINASGSVAAAVSDAGTVHCYTLSGGASGAYGSSAVGGSGTTTTPSVGSALKGAVKFGMGMMPTAVAKSKYVQPIQSYTNAENAIATFRLSEDMDADGEVQQSTPPLNTTTTSSYSTQPHRAGAPLDASAHARSASELDSPLETAAGHGHTQGNPLIYEADGFGAAAQTQPPSLSTEFVCLAIRPGLYHDHQATMLVAQGALAGASTRVKSRCMRVSIDTRGGTCSKEATYLFPKEEL